MPAEQSAAEIIVHHRIQLRHRSYSIDWPTRTGDAGVGDFKKCEVSGIVMGLMSFAFCDGRLGVGIVFSLDISSNTSLPHRK